MLSLNSLAGRGARCSLLTAMALALVVACCLPLSAQVFVADRAVGGISISPDGLLESAALDAMGKLSEARRQALQAVPSDLGQASEMRKVSLRRLEAAIERSAGRDEDLPDEIKYLAGLQQICYIFVYPDAGDIVLVGPGEGWKVDRRGNVVGAFSRRPVMLLDDLLVALRTARQAAQGGIRCSIDPDPQRVLQLQSYLSQFRTMGDPDVIARGAESALGLQTITVAGVPSNSPFARVLVAADYRMKRLGMGFDKAPVRGLPSYLQMMRPGRRGAAAMPRWWLEPRYEPLLRSPDGLAWQLRGGSVKAMTEEDFVNAQGNRQHSGKAGPAAQRWADILTEKYDELAVADPVFGQLRNCMELAIVAALIVKERLTERAGYSLPILLDPADVEVAEFTAPKHVDSKVNMLRKGRNWIISASGGVLVNSWSVADNVQQSDSLAPLRDRATANDPTTWRWN